MAFTFSMKDTYRQSVEAASGGKQTVRYDNKGIPSVMNIIPQLTYKDVGLGSSTAPLPAFVINGKNVDQLYIGTYMATVHDGRAYSLPGQVPKVYTDHDQAVALCRAKGDGWHCMTNAEYAAIALWCKANGYYPRGNNNYGSDVSAPHERCRPGTKGSDGRTNLGLTGSGPSSWTHDGTPNGIYGLNGDAWEWSTGLRIVNGEIQILVDNNAALPTADFTVGSAQWKAILQNGTPVVPGTADTLKYSTVSGKPTISTVLGTPVASSCAFKDIAVGAGITIPDVLKGLALYPSDNSDHGGDSFYVDNTQAERLFFRGGSWDGTSAAGVFALNGGGPRSNSYDGLGFRVAFADVL
ncbi:MAG: hypothetical protein RSE04_06080 [Hydrogenoanaerobacterium sp.]